MISCVFWPFGRNILYKTGIFSAIITLFDNYLIYLTKFNY